MSNETSLRGRRPSLSARHPRGLGEQILRQRRDGADHRFDLLAGASIDR
jgi:hypothetical protein